MIEREVVTDDGVRLWTVEDGTGPTLVLCHGGPGQWDYLGPVSSMLRDIARVVRWDQRGCGRSSPAPVQSVMRAVEDLETIRDAFGVEDWIVGGHSWGASLALQYRARKSRSNPRVALHLGYRHRAGVEPPPRYTLSSSGASRSRSSSSSARSAST